MTRFRFNEVVDVTVKGVRVVGEHDQTGALTVRDENGNDYPMPPQAAATRVAPAEWPPRPGDLWRDRRGDLWFACDVRDIDETDVPEVAMVYAHEDHRTTPEDCNQSFGPLTFVRREDEQDAAAHDKPSVYADLVGERVGVQRTDGEYLTGVLTVADTYAVTIKVDRPVNGVPNRDVRAEDIATVRLLPAKDGGDRG